MIGGLWKSTSCLALVAAAGLMGAAPGVQAADFGGDCCADLEERVAELEATTVRKGNRKVSLTISGQVNEALMWWDDGRESNFYTGTNMISQTRFRFVGEAKITPSIKAGYLLEVGTEAPSLSNNNATNDDVSGGVLAIRHSAWWLGHKDLGKIWLGQTSQATDGVTEINLANTGHFATANSAAYIGGFAPRTALNGGAPSALNPSFYNILGGRDRNTAQVGEGYRFNVVKYETPAMMGFILSAAWGEDDTWDLALRYAGEFSGIKLAFGVGYSENTDGSGGAANDRGCIFRPGNKQDVNCQHLGASASIMHVPTGLFVHGAYGRKTDDNAGVNIGGPFPIGEKQESWMWYVQAGIEQNFFGVGKTTLFGEYQQWDIGATQSGFGTGTPANIVLGSASMTMWGAGLNQAIDSAAMDLYVHYRNYNDISSAASGASAPGTIAGKFSDFQSVMAGALIKF